MVSARRSGLRSGATVCLARRTPPGRPGGLGALPDDVTAARHLIASGCHADAVRLLATHLAGLDHSWTPADPLLIDACVLYATHATGRDQLGAARYAHRASRDLHEQPTHPRRLAAAHAYGTALHTNRRFVEAIDVYRQLLAAYHALGRLRDILTTTIPLAESLHAAGHCVQALYTIDCGWRIWQHTDPDTLGLGLGQTIATTQVRMLRACRRDHDLRALIRVNQHIEAGHLLTTAAAGTEDVYADGRHALVCSHTPQTPAAWHSEHRNLTGDPPGSLLDGLALHGGTGDDPHLSDWESVQAHFAPAGSAEVTTAISRALDTPQAQAVLRRDLGPHTGAPTSRWTTATVVGYLAYRRARRAWRASPYTTAVVLPSIVFALTLAVALVSRR